MIRKYLLSVLILLVFSCSKKEGKIVSIEKHYKNGQLYCKGKQIVKGKKVKKIGLWTFYYSNGNIKTQAEYDNKGKFKTGKTYNFDKKIIYSQTNTENSQIETYYYKNGNIEKENIITYEEKEVSETDKDSYDVVIKVVVSKEYLENGQLQSRKQIKYIDGDKIYLKEWNKDQELILEIKYKNGHLTNEENS